MEEPRIEGEEIDASCLESFVNSVWGQQAQSDKKRFINFTTKEVGAQLGNNVEVIYELSKYGATAKWCDQVGEAIANEVTEIFAKHINIPCEEGKDASGGK